MKKVINFFKTNESKIKIGFSLSIFILVLVEFFRLSKTISWPTLQSAFASIPPFNIVLMILIGLVAVMPMIGYDVIFNRLLGTSHSKKYIIENSWSINTINNMIGFGGIVDVGLRLALYSDGIDNGKSIKVLSRLLPYFSSGLSVLSTVILLFAGLFTEGSYLHRFLIIFVVAAFYFPVVLWISSRENLTFFGNVERKVRLELTLISVLEWSGCVGSFLAVGYLMGFHFSIVQVAGAYILAILFGMISFIPGGIGSFDLTMMTALTMMGFASTDVILWTLLYRMVYDILPFALGVVLFVKNLGKTINDHYKGIPKELTVTLLRRLIYGLVVLFGIFLVLSATIPEKVNQIHWLKQMNPIHANLIWQFPSILIGSLYILLGRSLLERVRQALPFGIGLIFVSLIWINAKSFSNFTSLYLIILLLLLVFFKNNLTVDRLIYSWESLLKDSVIFLGLIISYLFLGMPHYLIHHKEILQLNKFAISFLGTIIVVGICYTIIVHLLRKSSKKLGESFDAEAYRQFLDTQGNTSDRFLPFLGDKQLFWYPNKPEASVVLQFSLDNNKAVVMGEPIGDKDNFQPAINAFIRAARDLNYSPVFYEIGQELTLYLHECGFEFMKFGESALVHLQDFTLTGKSSKSFRRALNFVEKEGFTFDIIQPPYAPELITQLRSISDSWLDGRQEKGFSLGFFKEDYLQMTPMALVRNDKGKIVAFANIILAEEESVVTVDLMRYDKEESPSGVMDYLFISLFLHYKEEGYRYFDLGMAPLSNVGINKDSFIQERIGFLVYSFTSRFYSFEGLRKYKQKFAPEWQPRYISYMKSSWLACDLLAIYRIDNRTLDQD